MSRTGIFTIGAAIVIAIVDLFFVLTGNETISQYLYELALRYPALPFLFGFLCGHLFWPIKKTGQAEL